MKEIIELNNRILMEAREAVPKEFGFLMLMRNDDWSTELAGWPTDICTALLELKEKLHRAIPNDFSYSMVLGDYNPDFVLTYRDGSQTEGDCSVNWSTRRSIFHQLNELNWDKHRGNVLERGQIFDEVTKRAKTAKPNLPKTKAIQQRFASEVKVFENTKREANSTHLLLWHEPDGVVEIGFENLKALRDELIHLLPTDRVVIAIVSDGKPVPPSFIDEFRSEALKDLKAEMPISYSKAIGLFHQMLGVPPPMFLENIPERSKK